MTLAARLADRLLRPEVKQSLVASVPPAVWRPISLALHGETRWQKAWRRYWLRAVTSAAPRPGEQRVVAVSVGGVPRLARVVGQADEVWQQASRNLALVAAGLESAGVHFTVLPDRSGFSHRVIVSHDARRIALRGLAGIAGLCVGTPVADTGGRWRARRRRQWRSGSRVVPVFEVVSAHDGTILAADDRACRLEFWELGEDDVLRAPSSANRRTELRAADRVPALDRIGSVEYPTFSGLLEPDPYEVHHPVDAVYTWVDGSDPVWRARKAEALGLVDASHLHDLATSASRYLSREELRYSLRSLEMHAGWIRHVWLVTDDQVPDWLVREHPRLTVVSHRELFGDTGRLPTFNSHAIESRLHRIEGLSEHYLYLNDDVFFGRPVRPELFFHANGVMKIILSRAQIGRGPVDPDDAPVTAAAKNGRDLLLRQFGTRVTHKLKHVPHVQRRSVVTEMEETFPDAVARTAASQFRHPDDISVASSLHHHYAWLTGRAVPGEIRYYYADIAAPQTEGRLRRLLRRRDYDAFCLNDHDDAGVDHDAQARIIRTFLEAYYPVPSTFEQ